MNEAKKLLGSYSQKHDKFKDDITKYVDDKVNAYNQSSKQIIDEFIVNLQQKIELQDQQISSLKSKIDESDKTVVPKTDAPDSSVFFAVSFVTINPAKKDALPIKSCCSEELKLIKLPRYCDSMALLIIAWEAIPRPFANTNHHPVNISAR